MKIIAVALLAAVAAFLVALAGALVLLRLLDGAEDR